ncbi:hypothetical protein BDP55DRAFT_130041 [Colletotrichum godetiae]|uniref:Uncharacterized protein n=1 Tax=Colletotrichum godetiae TaxID=1209918 RepID=A0AAJ0AY14_9PEZI|nr:uncharacterized protein BDP55DRAFT_130041 [Colletotrichum godetiae]KAK1700397.1 hypothetical protein BDP55DRAFT_130041 [Colletotrichum godetiae]
MVTSHSICHTKRFTRDQPASSNHDRHLVAAFAPNQTLPSPYIAPLQTNLSPRKPHDVASRRTTFSPRHSKGWTTSEPTSQIPHHQTLLNNRHPLLKYHARRAPPILWVILPRSTSESYSTHGKPTSTRRRPPAVRRFLFHPSIRPRTLVSPTNTPETLIPLPIDPSIRRSSYQTIL